MPISSPAQIIGTPGWAIIAATATSVSAGSAVMVAIRGVSWLETMVRLAAGPTTGSR